MYLWFKLLHVFFIISWFAGLFYLPRIYVNLAQVDTGNRGEYQRLLGMAQRLFKFMTPLGIGAVIAGFAVPFVTGWWGMGWVHTKVTLGVILLGYHFYCYRLLLDFQENRNRYSHKWYRVFNEIPVVIMAASLYLVIFKPF
ncbi:MULTISPECIES: CopD family protein [unclassified Neisseria]|uniref:CopD family protein n=1 Tax=unclassified Neisseria TaxID=2623750 RepID=UPI0026668D04|nr:MULTISPECIES: CopD family protein [unclassified Neisseria]MDO1509694.1 CopD family protein [Neisseria sp. MVDL19-042950]MDO1515982.1 CopD family protein [Neisseria sp. MVDL18-041461]MDO1563095.1 CopD family protein [Neisseria sp. MVDL20-010259]